MSDSTASTLTDLRQQLHQANERYHASRQAWERWLDATEFRHDERVTKARDDLQQAERAVEAIEDRIKQALQETT